MSFKRILEATRKGEALNEKEIKYLAKYLKLNKSTALLVFKIILSLLSFAPLIWFVIFSNSHAMNETFRKVILILLSIVGVVLFLTIFFKKNRDLQNRRIVAYLSAVEDFYSSRIGEYEGFETLFLRHEFMVNGYLQNGFCLFMTDGYDFYIFDDFLKSTNYELPKYFRTQNNKTPMLKVIDPEFAKKRPINFKLADINNYHLSAPFNKKFKEEETDAYHYSRYTYADLSRLNEFCLLELNDRCLFKMSPELVYSLRRRAPKKENI